MGYMSKYNLIATSTFGLEAIVAQELTSLGHNELKIEDGRVSFFGDERAIAQCNIWLRTADRVLLKLAEFKALDFEELFQGVLAIKWEEFIPIDGKMHVTGKSVKSKLFSVPDCQRIVKKAVITAMKRRYNRQKFEETGALYRIEISILNDIAMITIDTSGNGLHKRGYREEIGEAPLRENLAAAMILLSRWNPTRLFSDPLCGSGTIPIEAALIGKNIAPGLYRPFSAEDWQFVPRSVWKTERENARSKVNNNEFKILASDTDGEVLKKARINAKNAHVADCIQFKKEPVEEFKSGEKYGCIVCNPPYGERIGDLPNVENLYRSMGRIFNQLDSWSYFILTAHPDFEKCFGSKADKNRKLYNGNLKCYLYQYYGPLPKSPRPNNLTNKQDSVS